MTCVWIAYDPRVFREALIHLLSKLDCIEIVENASEKVDVGIFRLAETGQLQDFFLHKSLPQAKMIVFSPRGDQAFIRLPEETRWRRVRPFGMSQLVSEIRAGREKCISDLTNQTVIH
jgi:hypothetical protein